MTLLQTVPYLRRPGQFTMADRYGSWVAHQDVVRAVLHHGAVDSVHFVLPYGRNHTAEDVHAGLAALRADFPGRPVAVWRGSDLRDLARKHRYVLADDFEYFDSLAVARFAEQRCLFPVTTIVHTIPRRAALLPYVTVSLIAEPFDAIVATSEACRRSLEAIFEEVDDFIGARRGGGTRRERVPIVTIPLAVDDQFLAPRDQTRARTEMNLPADAVIFLYVGRLSETFKADLEPLLYAFARFRRTSTSNALLLIAGQDATGSYVPVLRTLAQQFDIEDSVRLVVNFVHEAKPLLYAAADVFVSPVDNLQETFGLSVLEAMAAGKPVVASDWSGYRDLVVHGVTGLLIPTSVNIDALRLADRVAAFSTRTEHFVSQQTVVDANALHRALDLLAGNRALRSQLGEQGRNRVLSTFCWRMVIERYAELWREQWACLSRAGTQARWRSPANTERQFGHFATAFLDPTTTFRSSRCREKIGGADLSTMAVAHPLQVQDVQRALNECRQRPTSSKTLTKGGHEMASCALMWLWKKGYIEPEIAQRALVEPKS